MIRTLLVSLVLFAGCAVSTSEPVEDRARLDYELHLMEAELSRLQIRYDIELHKRTERGIPLRTAHAQVRAVGIGRVLTMQEAKVDALRKRIDARDRDEQGRLPKYLSAGMV